jgi:hypothetical protein
MHNCKPKKKGQMKRERRRKRNVDVVGNRRKSLVHDANAVKNKA